jgi:hypothetical protein
MAMRRAHAAFERLEMRRLLAIVNVANFGALPSDGINDTAAIQSAINASAAGDAIQFNPGVYDIGRLNIRSSRTYRGEIGATLRSTGEEFALDLQEDARDVTITNLRVEGAGVAIGRGQRSDNVRITEITFAGLPTHAIRSTVYSDRLLIERNTFKNVQGYGVLEAYHTDRLSFSYNRIIDSEHGGHILGPLDDNRFVGNFMSGIEIMGLEIQRDPSATSVSRNLLVEGNVIWDWRLPNGGSFGLSVVAEGGLNTIIRGNYLRNNIAPGSTWNPDLRGQGYTLGPAIEAGFETGVVENNVSGGPTQWTAHVGAAGINMLVRNNKFYGRAQYGEYIFPWPSIYGTGTFIDENNLKDPNGANMPAVPPLPGDANTDGSVDLRDFAVLSANMGRTNATLSQGDFNGDRAVNLLDYNLLAANFGRQLWPT